MRWHWVWVSTLVGLGVFASAVSGHADESAAPIKAGIIGLDAHALAWTRIINDPKATGVLSQMIVVAGYPGGSPDIPQSMELLNKQVGPLRELGVGIVNSIDELLDEVDVVLLLSIDGRAHLKQVSAQQTLEILAFMEAADQSKLQGGRPVTIKSVMKKARQAVAP